MSSAAFRALLEAGDATALRAAWGKVAPHLPQPQSNADAEITMHMARTASETIEFKHRAYSHKWLTERAMRSQLPDKLKPEAEKIYPRIVDAVGVSVNFRSEFMRPATLEVRGAIEYAIEDAYASGRKDPAFVSLRMREAKERSLKKLFGVSKK